MNCDPYVSSVLSGTVYDHSESFGAGYLTFVSSVVTGDDPPCPYVEASGVVGAYLALI